MSRQQDLDNHTNQLSPSNDAYWTSRGDEERPDDWEERVDTDEPKAEGEQSGSR